MALSAKQMQFNTAMERYQTLARYGIFNNFVSVANVSLQIYLLCLVFPHSIGALWQVVSFLLAFVITDFVNGLVHMFMDNNDRYDLIFGPFIANFHLHHKVVQYNKKNLLQVYFYESGSKVWLVGYLGAVCFLFDVLGADSIAMHVLAYVGILSSLAEVSHYLCHSSDGSLALLLGNTRILLHKRHHARHHLEDNNNYAFLNGCSDPLLNLLATVVYPGYKRTTDTHYAQYAVANTESR